MIIIVYKATTQVDDGYRDYSTKEYEGVKRFASEGDAINFIEENDGKSYGKLTITNIYRVEEELAIRRATTLAPKSVKIS